MSDSEDCMAVSGPYCLRCRRWLTDWFDACQRNHSHNVALLFYRMEIGA